VVALRSAAWSVSTNHQPRSLALVAVLLPFTAIRALGLGRTLAFTATIPLSLTCAMRRKVRTSRSRPLEMRSEILTRRRSGLRRLERSRS
jgi:hypothetical protein